MNPGIGNDRKPTESTGSGAVRVREGDEDNASNVSPEEQEMYDNFVTNGMSIMHSDEGLPALLKAIEGDENPVEGLANAVSAIVMRLEDSAEKQGVEISPDVLMHGGLELMEQAADLAEQAGVHAFTDEEMEGALYIAMDLYRQARQKQGKISQETANEEMGELMAAEQAGTLEDDLPGITERSKQSGRSTRSAGKGPKPAARAVKPMRRGLMNQPAEA
jgi:hypothetical protein